PPRALAVAQGAEPRAARPLPPLDRSASTTWSTALAAGLMPWGWVVLLVGPPLLAWFGRRRLAPRRATAAEEPGATPLSRLGRLEHAFHALLASHVPDPVARDGDGLARALRAAGVESAVADHVMRLRDRLRAARYGPRGLGDAAELAAELAQVLKVLGAEPSGSRRRLLVALCLGVLLGPRTVVAQGPSAEALYEVGALRAAADSFAARAAARPAVAAHWYNLGATLYRAGADGKAAAAWAMAARLTPRAPLVRRARQFLPPPDAASESLLATGVATPSEWALAAAAGLVAPPVADQIAAGGVVERPASVVKELVENALDAGARAIRVAIEDGGKTLIRVSDDGEGMGREDAALALSRHATSKIRDPSDLIGVATFGFRGEALPAIAAVARFELETSPDGRSGTRIGVVGGKRQAVEDAVRQRGTSVTVRALFFNTPARRKFLRAQATET